MPKAPPSFAKRVAQYTSNLAIVAIIKTGLLLPYHLRVPLVGRLVQHLVGPIAGYRRRALINLEMVWPDLPLSERKAIAAKCLNNVGRTFIENYSSRAFPARFKDAQIQGAGFKALQDAADRKQPVILVTGHYGNYEAVRAALVAKGFDVGGLYRNMHNPYFNAHYVRTMEAFGGPVFAQGRTGTTGFVRHLRQGGQLVLLFDQHINRAPVFDFLGHPAKTATSAADLALRYNALLIPFYGIRQENGLDFDIWLEKPIAHASPEEMTQKLNDNLAERIKQDPTQWFWVHRRWRADKTK